MEGGGRNLRDVEQFGESASAACTRAGILALSFAALGFSIAPLFAEYRGYQSLLEVAQLRAKLAIAVAEMTAESCWAEVVLEAGGTEAAEEISLFRLGQHVCSEASIATQEHDAARGVEELRQKMVAAAGSHPPKVRTELLIRPSPELDPEGRPLPPDILGMAIVYQLPMIAAIAEALERLFDDELLIRAQRYATQFNLEVWRWWIQRDRVDQELARARGRFHFGDLDLAGEPDLDQSRRAALAWRVKDVRSLVADEPRISITDIERLAESRFHVLLPELTMGLRLKTATAVLLTVSLALTSYFWAYAAEATRMVSYPTSVNLFRVFLASRVGAAILLLLMTLPATSSVYLAVASWQESKLGAPLAMAICAFSIDSIRRVFRITLKTPMGVFDC